jgi:hypothetical protein
MVMNCKGFGKKRPNFKVQSQHLHGGSKEKDETCQSIRFLGRDFNLGPPEYVVGVLTTRPRRVALPSFALTRGYYPEHKYHHRCINNAFIANSLVSLWWLRM